MNTSTQALVGGGLACRYFDPGAGFLIAALAAGETKEVTWGESDG